MACGRGPRSSLRVLRHGLEVSEMAVSELPGNPNAVWTVKKRVDGQSLLCSILSPVVIDLFWAKVVVYSIYWCYLHLAKSNMSDCTILSALSKLPWRSCNLPRDHTYLCNTIFHCFGASQLGTIFHYMCPPICYENMYSTLIKQLK